MAQELYRGNGTRSRDALATEFGAGDIFFERHAEMRYRGQRHNIKVPVSGLNDRATIRAAFDRDYKRRYGHADAKAPAEFQALHLVRFCAAASGRISRVCRARRAKARQPTHAAGLFRQRRGLGRAQVYERDALAAGLQGAGPAVIEEYGSTTLVWPGDRFEIGATLVKSASTCAAECIGLDATNARPRTRKQPPVDPITLEVIRHGIVSITDQIDANITRTAFSPYIYEYKDFAVGLVERRGRSCRAMHRRHAGFRRRFGRHGGARRAGRSTAASVCTEATSSSAITPRCRASISTIR